MDEKDSNRAAELACKVNDLLCENRATRMERVQGLAVALLTSIAQYETEGQRMILAEVVTDEIKRNVEAARKNLEEYEQRTENDGGCAVEPVAEA